MKPVKSTFVRHAIPFIVSAVLISGCSSSNDTAAIESVAEDNADDAIVELEPVSNDEPTISQGSIEVEPTEVEPTNEAEPAVLQDPPTSVMDSLDNSEAPGTADLLPSASCNGLLHPNGLTY